MKRVIVLPKGQITIPKSLRDKYGIRIGDILKIEEKEDGILIKKAKSIFDLAQTIEIDESISIDDLIEEVRTAMGKENVL